MFTRHKKMMKKIMLVKRKMNDFNDRQIFATQLSLQPILMNPSETTDENEKIVNIPEHTLFGNFPPKIPEAEIKPMALILEAWHLNHLTVRKVPNFSVKMFFL